MTGLICVASCGPSMARQLTARPQSFRRRQPRVSSAAIGSPARRLPSLRHRAVKKEVDAEASSEDEQTADTSNDITAHSDAVEAEDKPSFTQEEIAAMAAERRAMKKEAASSSNAFTGALEEARLIVWPNIMEAVINTCIVIAMVFVSAAMLFGVNTGLAALSNTVYGSALPTPQAGGQPALAAAKPAVQADAPKLQAPASSNLPTSLGSD